MKMKKALVTGAAGFIGSHVVRLLLQEGVEVRGLLYPGESRKNLEGLDVERIEGDICDADSIRSAFDGVDTVFHLAAIYAIWMPAWSRIYEVNLQGSRNVLWGALRANVQRVVYTSSIAGIGIAPGKETSDETTPFNQHTLGHHYVLTKHLSQQEALTFAANGLDLVVVNPAFPFGPHDIAPTPTGQILLDIVKGKNRWHFGGGLNVVDVRDVALGHVLAAKKGKTGEMYLLCNLNVTLRQLNDLVLKVIGKPGRLTIGVARSLARSAATGFTWHADHVSHKAPMSTPMEIDYASQYLFFDNSKARRELGMEFRPLEDSIRDAIEWFELNGYLKRGH